MTDARILLEPLLDLHQRLRGDIVAATERQQIASLLPPLASAGATGVGQTEDTSSLQAITSVRQAAAIAV